MWKSAPRWALAFGTCLAYVALAQVAEAQTDDRLDAKYYSRLYVFSVRKKSHEREPPVTRLSFIFFFFVSS